MKLVTHVVAAVAGVAALLWGIVQLGEAMDRGSRRASAKYEAQLQEQTQRAKASCIERGGTVSERYNHRSEAEGWECQGVRK